jgi:DNA polymerase III delta prime subunit
MSKVIVGQDDVIEQLLIALFSRGHCLLEGVPGLAKTLMISTLARCLSMSFARIQFTPDLMPADITGTDVLQENRDTGKRPIMAELAAHYSDAVILTSDNPRTEDPIQILKDMEAGLNDEVQHALTIADRAQAIKTAISMAEPGDILLVAGKGHEKYQEINGVKHDFDDLKTTIELFKKLEK